MPFTKLDSGIVDSSLWAAPDHVLRVWIAILAKKDYNGVVKMAPSALQRLSNIFNDIDGIKFREAINVLESPDPESRTPDFEGRRIEKIEGGWVVLNHKLYRKYSYSNDPSAVRQRKHREKEKEKRCDMSQLSRSDGDISVSVSESVFVSLEEEHEKEISEFETFKLIYPGQKRETETEFKELSKHVDYKKVLWLLVSAMKTQMESRKKLSLEKKFVPSWKSLKHYLADRGWEEQISTPIQKKEPIYHPPLSKEDREERMKNIESTVDWKYMPEEKRALIKKDVLG